MCCGNRMVAAQQARATAESPTWQVLDPDGKVVDSKTSEIAAKLAAARIGGTTRRG